MTLTFWGNSSFGDSTEKFSALVRVLPAADPSEGVSIDVISDQWLGTNPPGCSNIWQVFPKSAALPSWLQTPSSAEDLHTDDSLYYLAASLIKNGAVDASACENSGLASDLTANVCGVEAASSRINYWQTQLDQEILKVAKSDDVPARLLKNMFLKESQLWPGIYDDSKEVGLGQLTENGADTALLWNPDFFASFCPMVFYSEVCDAGFASLGEERQEILRSALLQKTNASCPTCPDGIDLAKTGYTMHVFAETIKANCSQTNQLIENVTQRPASEVSSYSDLWRFTLANYNAGPGCLGDAFQRAWESEKKLDWENVSQNLDASCQGAVNYVADIAR